MERNIGEDLKNPYLFEENRQGEYEYGVNEYGGKTASGSLYLTDHPERDRAAQRKAGGDARRERGHRWGADEGGHLIGARFAGEKGEANLTAQNENLNRGTYKSMENGWERHLDNGDKVFVSIESDGGERPEAYMGYAIYESPEGTRDYDTFSYVNESSSEQEKWETDYNAYLSQHQEDASMNYEYGSEEACMEHGVDPESVLGPEME